MRFKFYNILTSLLFVTIWLAILTLFVIAFCKLGMARSLVCFNIDRRQIVQGVKYAKFHLWERK